MSWAAWKCKQPQKVNKLGSGSSHKWQSEPFPANSRDFYLTIWKWHSKNCSLGTGKVVLHYRKEAWIWLKSKNVLLGVQGFFVCFIEGKLKIWWSPGSQWSRDYSNGSIYKLTNGIWGRHLQRCCLALGSIISQYSQSFALCQNRPKIYWIHWNVKLQCSGSVRVEITFVSLPTGVL